MTLATAVDPANAVADTIELALALSIFILIVIATLRWEPLDIPPGPHQRRAKTAIICASALWAAGFSLIALADLLLTTSAFLIVEAVGVAALIAGISLFAALFISMRRHNWPSGSA